MNGASEATLQDLLAVAQAMNTNLVGLNRLIGKMSSGGGGGSTGGGGSGGGISIPPLGPAGMAANVALGGLKVATGAVSAVFGVLGSIIGKTVTGLVDTGKNLYNFAKAAAEGRAKLSDFYDAFRDMPFFIGTIASLAADIIRYQEGMLDSYMTMTRAGATFSGSLTVMRDIATRGFLSLAELTKIVRENSEVFSTMGGNVDAGIRKFVDVQSKLMGPGSRYSLQLLGMGYTFESVAEIVGQTFKQQGDMTKSQFRDHAKLAESIFNSAKELDLFSRATGKNREELEQQQKKISLDAAFRTFTAGFGPETQNRMKAAVAKTVAMAGEGAGDMLMQMFMTGGDVAVPLTQGAQDFAVIMGGQAEPMLRTIMDAVMDPTKQGAELLSAQMGAFYMAGQQMNNFTSGLGKNAVYMYLMNNGLMKQIPLLNLGLQIQGKSQQQFMAQAEAADKNQKATAGSAAALAFAQRRIMDFGSKIMEFVNTLVGPIADVLVNFFNKFQDKIFPFLDGLGKWIAKTFRELIAAWQQGGPEKLWDKIKEKVVDAFKNTKEFFQPVVTSLEKLWKDVTPIMIRAIEGMFDLIIYALRKNSFIARLLFGETEIERKEVRREEYESGDIDRKIARLAEMLENYPKGEAPQTLVMMYNRAVQDLADAKKEFGVSAIRLMRLGRGDEPPIPSTSRRHSGTIGMTGSWWEKENKVVEVQAGETVATPAQLAQIVDAAGQKGLPDSLQALNSTMRTLIAISQRIEENTKETVRATRSLTNDAFQMV